MTIRAKVLVGVLASCMAWLSGCGETTQPDAAQPKEAAAKSAIPRIAFIYIGTIGDEGWTYEHNRGRLHLEKKLGVKVDYVENVPESADAERVLTQLAQDHDIIIATSYGHMDYVYNTAARFPNTTFLHAGGYKTAKNMGNFFARNWEGSYLTGIAAGMVTKTNKIGYLASFPIPQLAYNINAFTLGAQSVNPDVEVSVVWNNSWYDPTNERSAAMNMADSGMDVLVSYPDSPATIKVAQERGVWGVGNSTEMAHYAPDAYLTNPIWNWGVYYERVIDEIMKGTWTSGRYLGGMEDGMIDIAEFGKNVPDAVKNKVNEVKAKILADEFNVFDGPLIDQQGKERYAAGVSMLDSDVLQMNWFVQGVKGSLPN